MLLKGADAIMSVREQLDALLHWSGKATILGIGIARESVRSNYSTHKYKYLARSYVFHELRPVRLKSC